MANNDDDYNFDYQDSQTNIPNIEAEITEFLKSLNMDEGIGRGNGSGRGNNNVTSFQITNPNKVHIGPSTKYNYYQSYSQKDNETDKKNTKHEKRDKIIAVLCECLGGKWSEVAENLGLHKTEIDGIRELRCGGSVDIAIRNMAKDALTKWIQNNGENATIENLFSALISADVDVKPIEELTRA